MMIPIWLIAYVIGLLIGGAVEKISINRKRTYKDEEVKELQRSFKKLAAEYQSLVRKNKMLTILTNSQDELIERLRKEKSDSGQGIDEQGQATNREQETAGGTKESTCEG